MRKSLRGAAFGLALAAALLARAPVGAVATASLVERTHQREAGGPPSLGAARTDWKQEHFDSAHSGSNPYEHTLSPANVSGLVPKWITNEPIRVQGTVVVVQGTVYVGGQDASDPALGHLFALDAKTGEKLWEATQPGGGPVNGIATCCGAVFVTTVFDHLLHAYDARTGEKRWELQATGAVSGPTVVGRRLFVQTNSGVLEALDALTGAILWRRHYTGFNAASPAAASGSLYVAGDNKVQAFRARDGRLRWKANLPDVAFSSPTVVDGVVYEAVLEAGIYALSARTGEVLWHQPTGVGTETTPTVDAYSVYVGDVEGNLYSFDRDTGAPRWTVALGWRFVLNDPVEANGVIYAATTGVFALDARTGAELWSAPTDIVNTDPPVVDGVLYVGDFDGNVTAYGLPEVSRADPRTRSAYSRIRPR